MIADLIHDFDSHLDSGHVWLVEVELEWRSNLNQNDPEIPNGDRSLNGNVLGGCWLSLYRRNC